MKREYSYKITKQVYEYLLPVFGIAAQGTTRLLYTQSGHFFIGTPDDHLDILNRCKYL